MKKLLICILLITTSNKLFAQDDTHKINLVSFNVGVGKPFIDNHAFETWAQTNYNKRYNNDVSVNADLNMAFLKHYDIGMRFGGSSEDFEYISFYAGVRLSPANSAITSFLNLEGM